MKRNVGLKDERMGNFVYNSLIKNRDLKFASVEKQVILSKKIAVKVVDIFGNDTMHLVEVKV